MDCAEAGLEIIANSNDDANPIILYTMADNNHAWTVSIIAQYDSKDTTIKDAYCELECSILAQKENPYIRYLIFLYDQRANTACIKELKDGYYGIMRRFEIVKRIKADALDFYSGNNIVAFLNNYSKSTPAHLPCGIKMRHLVLTWGHGAGYGFFAQKVSKTFKLDSLSKGDIIEQNRFLKAQFSISDKYILRKYESLKNEAQVDDIKVISVTQLKEILDKSLKFVDILLVMNCYMQSFELCYMLRKVVDLIIAPLTEIPFFGYNYIKLFNLLCEKPDSELLTIAKNISNYFPTKYIDEPFYSKTHIIKKPFLPEVTAFSAILLAGTCHIYCLINEISEYLINNFNIISPKCEHARLNIISAMSTQHLVDFRQFFIELSKLYNNGDLYPTELDEFHHKLLALRQTYMISSLEPGLTFEGDIDNGRQLCASKSPQFFSIFFPRNISQEDIISEETLLGYQQALPNFKWATFIAKMNGFII